MPMTTEKIREALLKCEAIIARQEDGISMAIRDMKADTKVRKLSHLLWLCRNGCQLLEDNRREKAMRWLSFTQGALWEMGLLSIEDAKNQNRPDDSKFNPEE